MKKYSYVKIEIPDGINIKFGSSDEPFIRKKSIDPYNLHLFIPFIENYEGNLKKQFSIHSFDPNNEKRDLYRYNYIMGQRINKYLKKQFEDLEKLKIENKELLKIIEKKKKIKEKIINENIREEIFYYKLGKLVIVKNKNKINGFKILKNSKLSPDKEKYKRIIKIRNILRNKKIIKKNKNNEEFFTIDYIVSTPSSAACIIHGEESNGWIKWKTINKITLNDIIKNKELKYTRKRKIN